MARRPGGEPARRSPGGPVRLVPARPRTALPPRGCISASGCLGGRSAGSSAIGRLVTSTWAWPPATGGSRRATLGSPGGRRSSSSPSTTSSRDGRRLRRAGWRAAIAPGTEPTPPQGVPLPQVSQLRDHRRQEPRAIRIGFPPRQEIADNIALVPQHRHRLGQQRRLPRPRPPGQPPVTLESRWRTRRSQPARRDARSASRCAGGFPGLWPSTQAPPAAARQAASAARAYQTPSRAHHAAGFATPGPQPGCAGSASSAVRGVAVIAESPARGACSVTTPSSSPPAITGPPDIPDHCDSPSAVCPAAAGGGR